MAYLKVRKKRTTGDKAMIAVIVFGIILLLTIVIFTLVSMEAGIYSMHDGLKALAAMAIFTALFYGALRKRLDGLIK